MFDLDGKTALVTGAGQNVGAGIARCLAERGAAVAVTAGIANAQASLGPIDILVNNAGIPSNMRIERFRDMDPESWPASIDLNLYGVLHCTKAVIWLASNEASWVTGQTIGVNGGSFGS